MKIEQDYIVISRRYRGQKGDGYYGHIGVS